VKFRGTLAYININTIEIARNQPQSLDYEEKSGNLNSTTKNESARRPFDVEVTDLYISITSDFLGLKGKYLIEAFVARLLWGERKEKRAIKQGGVGN